jgi:uncharacterized membrane protein
MDSVWATPGSSPLSLLGFCLYAAMLVYAVLKLKGPDVA